MRQEFAVIREILAPLGTGDRRAVGFADDAAVLPQKSGRETVVTTDTMVEGVHFPDTEDSSVVAGRLVRVNLSDLAAMGARPDAYFLNLVLPPRIDDAWLQDFAAGLGREQTRFGITLLGGDMTRTTGPLVVSLTALGDLPAGGAVVRGGARAGDIIMVSGTIGDAFVGLRELMKQRQDHERREQIARFRFPEPRIELGALLSGIATAMADISDGLIADLGHICTASAVTAEIRAKTIPLSPGVRSLVDTGEIDLSALLTGGDDYELVFAVPPGKISMAHEAGRRTGVPVSEIGTLTDGSGTVMVYDTDGEPLSFLRSGYRHF